ncbi:hypothetical protein GO755_26615 [Spirosoma sp. HMF4905]|uniref:Antirepressor protein C-terminal domain-containing protein n=1 Tax=Spirosoma arboris TaxID=2682092 RepID=A0A7K1SIK6_9BACT|nr:phage antirepressor KilAC domain-containing protein [Spirosoma arboris]MVM33640.1 hypothetical protein [Spirosoma arboris]
MNTAINLSNPATIKAYFEKVRQLAKSGEKYPVNLDEVWPLVYTKKQKAVDVLKKECFENEDYLFFTQKGENSGRGRGEIIYQLSVPCMEHLVARKVRAVFEIYRQVFHAVADQLEVARTEQSIVPASSVYYLPQNHIEALQAYIDQLKVTQEQQLQIEAAKPKLEQYKRTMDAEGYYTIAEVAKMIGTGQNRLFDFLRNDKILFYHRGHNQPYQQFVDQGWFMVRQKTFRRGDKEESYPQLFVTPKGVEAIRKRWDNSNDSDEDTPVVPPTPAPTSPPPSLFSGANVSRLRTGVRIS